MSTSDAVGPQLYLITPGRLARDSFPDLLAELLDAVPIAAVRLELESRDEETISVAADSIRGICHARDVPLIITEHYRMVRSLGLDGVHLLGTKSVRDARQELGQNAIIGSFCGNSRHAGMTSGEIGADYVSFGPLTAGNIGTNEPVDAEVFEWWSQMIEVPSVAEGGISLAQAESLKGMADFFALGSEVWKSDGLPLDALKAYAEVLGLTK